jgi:hypothetical protein
VKKTITLSLFLVLVLSSCLKDKITPVPDTGDCFEISYKYNIRPIIELSCKPEPFDPAACHNSGANGDWDDYNNIASFISAGIWQTRLLVDKTMPNMPNIWEIDSLNTDELKTIQCWIDQGYPEN